MNREPRIVRESDTWALVWKPHDMPTAPLVCNETGTLLEWFLQRFPEASAVRGKKAIEHGLVHRLDTGTEGLVLIAKTQNAFDFFDNAQKASAITKTYRALCSRTPDAAIGPDSRVPVRIESRFRPWGPGGREVKALFPNDRGYADAKHKYCTLVCSIRHIKIDAGTFYGITCQLDRGARHQVRCHLSQMGYPIIGDSLYNAERFDVPLQLCANGIDFPDPDSDSRVSVLLQQPDRMSL